MSMSKFEPGKREEKFLEKFLATDPAETLANAREIFEGPLLEALKEAREAREQAQTDLDTVVARAREEGVSWRLIGAVLGMTKQGAHSFYSPRIAKLAAPSAKPGKQLPEELTSSLAADVLGVTRPTLMKWAQEGRIASHKVGMHTRFYRDDVLALSKLRAKERGEAFAEFRALDAEYLDVLND